MRGTSSCDGEDNSKNKQSKAHHHHYPCLKPWPTYGTIVTTQPLPSELGICGLLAQPITPSTCSMPNPSHECFFREQDPLARGAMSLHTKGVGEVTWYSRGGGGWAQKHKFCLACSFAIDAK